MNDAQDKKILPKIVVDSYTIENRDILAYCLIDEADKDFKIDRAEFEYFCEKHDVKSFYFGSKRTEWAKVYDDNPLVYKLLTQYIEDLYIQKTFDIISPLKLF